VLPRSAKNGWLAEAAAARFGRKPPRSKKYDNCCQANRGDAGWRGTKRSPHLGKGSMFGGWGLGCCGGGAAALRNAVADRELETLRSSSAQRFRGVFCA